MRIGIDIDDTLVSTKESFDYVMNKYNVNFNKSWKEKWNNKERDFIFKNYLKEILTEAKFKENAIEVLRNLNELGHELIIITARTESNCNGIEEFTKQLMIKNNIKIANYYFAKYQKSDVAKELKLDLMIDDNIDVYNNMLNENIDCILFGDKIKNWNDVLGYINQKEE